MFSCEQASVRPQIQGCPNRDQTPVGELLAISNVNLCYVLIVFHVYTDNIIMDADSRHTAHGTTPKTKKQKTTKTNSDKKKSEKYKHRNNDKKRTGRKGETQTQTYHKNTLKTVSHLHWDRVLSLSRLPATKRLPSTNGQPHSVDFFLRVHNVCFTLETTTTNPTKLKPTFCVTFFFACLHVHVHLFFCFCTS